MAQYLLRKNKVKYEITKFDDSTYPIDTYTVTTRSCTCPSYRLCKHITLLKKWKELGEPIGLVLDDASNTLGKLHFA